MNHALQAAPARAQASAPAPRGEQPHRAAAGDVETSLTSRAPTPDDGGTVASQRWETDGGAVWTD